MKNFFQIITLFLAISIFGQTVSDFRYIMIPGTFKNEKANRYDLNDFLLRKLKEKKYTVLYENRTSWPQDAVENPCSVLNAELIDISSMFRNKIELKLFDCNGKEISSFEGKSNIKDFEPGMQDALKTATIGIPVSNPVKQELTVTKEKVAENKNQSSIKTTEIIAENSSNKSEANSKIIKDNSYEIYSNGNLNFNKINLSNGEFILSNPNNSSPYGIFKPTTKKEVYRVQLNDNAATIGYIENGNIVVELLNSDGTYRKEVFLRK